MKRLFGLLILFASTEVLAATFSCISMHDSHREKLTGRSTAGEVEMKGYFAGTRFLNAQRIVVQELRIPGFPVLEGMELAFDDNAFASYEENYRELSTGPVLNIASLNNSNHRLVGFSMVITKPNLDPYRLSSYRFVYHTNEPGVAGFYYLACAIE